MIRIALGDLVYETDTAEEAVMVARLTTMRNLVGVLNGYAAAVQRLLDSTDSCTEEVILRIFLDTTQPLTHAQLADAVARAHARGADCGLTTSWQWLASLRNKGIVEVIPHTRPYQYRLAPFHQILTACHAASDNPRTVTLRYLSSALSEHQRLQSRLS